MKFRLKGKRCAHCQRKLGLGVRSECRTYFCGKTCQKGYQDKRRAGVELVRLTRKPHPS